MIKLLTLLLALWGLPATAQTDGTDQDTSEETTTDTKEKTEPATPRAATDPFDYESSEQISEDLSVSFPVDI
ncbi:MAG: hypothetical protein ABJN62_04890 [Halioglobus sp.]